MFNFILNENKIKIVFWRIERGGEEEEEKVQRLLKNILKVTKFLVTISGHNILVLQQSFTLHLLFILGFHCTHTSVLAIREQLLLSFVMTSFLLCFPVKFKNPYNTAFQVHTKNTGLLMRIKSIISITIYRSGTKMYFGHF